MGHSEGFSNLTVVSNVLNLFLRLVNFASVRESIIKILNLDISQACAWNIHVYTIARIL